MPTYEYGCEVCGAHYELEQRITEASIKKCKKCGKLKAKRLISGGNFMLKGGGWYADGYTGGSNKSSPASSSTEGSSAPAADAKQSSAPVADAKQSSAPAADTKKSAAASD